MLIKSQDNRGFYPSYPWVFVNSYGSISAISDKDRNLVASYDFDAFGNETESTATYYNPMKYCGEYADSETGLIYLRARYYDPAIGRFISEDPVKDGLNWYVYCSNNPVMFVDPLGLAPGDPYKTMDEAAMNFGEEYYGASSYIRNEIGTLIYSYVDESGNTMYSYMKPKIGKEHSVNVMDMYEDVPEEATVVAGIHQHTNAADFSTPDQQWTLLPEIEIV